MGRKRVEDLAEDFLAMSQPEGTCYYCWLKSPNAPTLSREGKMWHLNCWKMHQKAEAYREEGYHLKVRNTSPLTLRTGAITLAERKAYLEIEKYIKLEEYLTLVTLSANIHVSYQTIQKIIKNLQLKGYLKYDSHDRTHKKYTLLKPLD